jgi:hypothetical protein
LDFPDFEVLGACRNAGAEPGGNSDAGFCAVRHPEAINAADPTTAIRK